MIAYLQGQIISRDEKNVILKCGQVGYDVFCTKEFISKIRESEEVEFFVHTHIREDCMDLYGFESKDQLIFFKQLITINGIGPKAALEILNFEVEKVKLAIINEDLAFITKVPGIGKKTAQRMIIDLKNKLEVNFNENYSPSLGIDTEKEVMEALIGLGYQRKHIKMRLGDLLSKSSNTEEIITYFLKNS